MEMPPLPSFLTLTTFLATFVILLSLGVSSAPALFYDPEEYKQHEYSEYFNSASIQKFNASWAYQMNETGGKKIMGYLYVVDVDIGNRNFDFEYTEANYSNPYCQIRHFYTTWWIIPNVHNMHWYNDIGQKRSTTSKPYYLKGASLNEDYANDHLPYTVKCSHFFVKVYFGYNETIYSTPLEAWNHHDLHILIGIDLDQYGTGMNALSLITMILFFQAPQINPYLNAIIAFPLWFCMGWLIASIIIAFLKSLPLT